jgi:hypothetical protein
MIKFRLGQTWKRESAEAGEPRDSFAFEVDGVNLLPGANDEPLVPVVEGLVEAVAQLVVDGELAGQLSLDEVQLELCFWRRAGLEVEVSVVSVGQPPRRGLPPIVVELPRLVEATLQCARQFLRELETTQSYSPGARAALEQRVKALGSTVVAECPARAIEPWTASRPADDGLGFTLVDAEARTLSFSRRTRAGLPSLMVEGGLSAGHARLEGLPFLSMMGLARAATEGTVSVGGVVLAPSAVFNAGLDLCLAFRVRAPALATNPWLEALQVRCVDGLKALRQPMRGEPSASVNATRINPGPPLAAEGHVRRVALAASWSRPVALGEDGGQLMLGRARVVVTSPHVVHAFTARGETASVRRAERGVGATATHSVCASPGRLLLFEGDAASASWLRDHDGTQLGPGLHRVGNVLVTSLAHHGAIGFCALTGRELWRFDPLRTQHAFLTVHGSRVLLGTDSGELHGIDLEEGQLRFTVRSLLPCVAPPVPAGRRALVLLNRGEHTTVLLCDALASDLSKPAGATVWARELLLRAPRSLVVAHRRAFVAGEHEGGALIVALAAGGQVLWSRSVPLDARTTNLVPWDRGVIGTDARGAAIRLLPDGKPTWVAGAGSDQLSTPIAPAISRRVLVVPGPATRLIDLATGRVLAELETGPRVIDVAVDRKLSIFVLKEPGLLEAWRPATVLAVVGATSPPRTSPRAP